MRRAESLENAAEPVSGAASPEREAIDADERTMLRGMNAALPAELRETLVLFAVEEMRSAGVAVIL